MAIIKNKKFTLRRLKMSDKESLARNINNKTIARNLLVIPYPYTAKDAKKFIHRTQKSQKKKPPEEIIFGIEIEGEVVGTVGIHRIKKNHQAEIGYWIGKKYWGKGIMTEVVKMVTAYCHQKLKLRRIYAKVFIFNEASKKVLEKNGYQLEGIMKKEALKKGKYIDAYLLAKIK
jgi:RimJ/RimL family protein N-acetyltransferase